MLLDGVGPSVLAKAYAGGSPPPFDQPGLVVGCDGGGEGGGGGEIGEGGGEGGDSGDGGDHGGGKGGSEDTGGNGGEGGDGGNGGDGGDGGDSGGGAEGGRNGGREGGGGENCSQQPAQSQPSSSLHRSRPFRAPHVVARHPTLQLGVCGGSLGLKPASFASSFSDEALPTPMTRSQTSRLESIVESKAWCNSRNPFKILGDCVGAAGKTVKKLYKNQCPKTNRRCLREQVN